MRNIPCASARAGSTDNGRIEIVARGTGSFRIGTASLMPADNIYGWRADTVALLKELDAPVYRWPGGNFVSGYNWRDGIGDPDKRPPRKNPAWKGIESNDVGIHEYMALMRELATEPYIAVNTGLADEDRRRPGSGVPQRRGLHAPGQTARPERPPRALRREVVRRGQ